MAREIGNPLGVIDELFAAKAEQNKVPPSEWGERAHFLQALQLSDEENFAKVPCLNDMQLVEQVKPFTLVRYRCLVQDVFEPELYSMILLEQNAHDPKQSRFVRMLSQPRRHNFAGCGPKWSQHTRSVLLRAPSWRDFLVHAAPFAADSLCSQRHQATKG